MFFNFSLDHINFKYGQIFRADCHDSVSIDMTRGGGVGTWVCSLIQIFQMAADNLFLSFRAFEILYTILGNVPKMDTPFQSGVPKSRLRWSAHTLKGIVGEYPPPNPGGPAYYKAKSLGLDCLLKNHPYKRAYIITVEKYISS